MAKHEWARLPGVAIPCPKRDLLPPSNHGSGAAEDTTAAPGSLEACTQAVYSRWGPSPSPSSASRCLRDPRLVVSPGPPRGQLPPQLRWPRSVCLQPRFPPGAKAEPLAPSPAPGQLAPGLSAQPPAPMPPAPPRSPSVKTLRKDKELQSTPLKASDGSRLLSRSRTWRTWMRASRTVYGSVGRGMGRASPGQQPTQQREVGHGTTRSGLDFSFRLSLTNSLMNT